MTVRTHAKGSCTTAFHRQFFEIPVIEKIPAHSMTPCKTGAKRSLTISRRHGSHSGAYGAWSGDGLWRRGGRRRLPGPTACHHRVWSRGIASHDLRRAVHTVACKAHETHVANHIRIPQFRASRQKAGYGEAQERMAMEQKAGWLWRKKQQQRKRWWWKRWSCMKDEDDDDEEAKR